MDIITYGIGDGKRSAQSEKCGFYRKPEGNNSFRSYIITNIINTNTVITMIMIITMATAVVSMRQRHNNSNNNNNNIATTTRKTNVH